MGALARVTRVALVGAGAALGVLGVRRALAPSEGAPGTSDRLAQMWDAARAFAADVREGMTEREAQLRAALGADADPDAAHLDPGQARELLEHPTAQHPTAQHPTAPPPRANHPTAEHPTAEHPTAEHPTDPPPTS